MEKSLSKVINVGCKANHDRIEFAYMYGQFISGVEHYEVGVSLEGNVLKWWYNVEFIHRTSRNSTKLFSLFGSFPLFCQRQKIVYIGSQEIV